MRLQDKIFKLIEEQRLLVFPNQISADSWADYYAVCKPGKAVFTDRLVSWDTFLESCIQVPQNAEKVENVHRLLFVSQYLKKERLDVLCPPGFPQSKAGFEDEIAFALPDLPKTLESDTPDYALKADVSKVLNAYRQYLQENNLYEKSFLVPDFSKAPQGTTVVFPSAVAEAVDPCLETLQASEEDLAGRIRVFDTSLAEIRYTLGRIRKLLEEGCAGYDIKITTASADLCPWLEAESERAGIPVCIVKGRKLSEFNAGRLFKAIKNVISNRWSAESVQNLFLNPAFPIKNRAEFEALLSFAVDYKVVPSDGAFSWLSKLDGNPLALQFALMKDRIQAFESARSFDALRQAIHAFEDDFLSEGLEEFRTVYTRCMEALESLVSIKGGDRVSSPFDFFLRLLSMTLYTPKSPSDAIAVYTYPSDAGMVAKHHFALGFSDSDTAVERRVPPYTEKEGEPITDGLIESYLSCGAEVSCALKTYSSDVSVPSFFTDRKQIEEMPGIVRDSLTDEEAMWANGILPLDSPIAAQKEWFEKALETSLKEKGKRVFQSADLPLKITATGLSAFRKCPFRWYCSEVLGIKETEYEADMTDNREVGKLLHDCLEDWLNEIKDVDSLATVQSREILQRIFEKRLNQYRHSSKAAYLPRQERIALHYPDIIFRFADAGLGPGLRIHKTEEDFDKPLDGYSIKGRIDCILENADGEFSVIDFKKKKVDKSSGQIQLYAMALDKLPVMGAYYNIEEGKLDTLWSSTEQLRLLLEDLKADIERMKEAVEKSAFDPTPSDENCKECIFRGVCRTRYVIK